MQERNYYVYRHLRNDTGKPFYVGLGKKNSKNHTYISSEYSRAYSKRGRSCYWSGIVNKSGHTVEIVRDELTKDEAVTIEKYFIALYGRSSNGGSLCNLTDGGDGAEGYIMPKEILAAKRKVVASPINDYLFNRTEFEPNTGCHIWMGSYSQTGNYPKMDRNGTTHMVSRFIYEKERGVKLFPSDWLVNNCKNKCCVNPLHFILSTKSEQVSTNNSKTDKLTFLHVKLVYSLYESRTWKLSEIFGIPYSRMSWIINNTYKYC
jgi:hypothetical protein